jgi:cell division protein FtsQ
MSETAAAVDPRMKARRIAVLRSQGRRRLHILVTVTGVALLAGLAIGISRTPLMDVDRITIGGSGVRAAEVLESTGIATGMPMVSLDLGRAERSVASLPWVRSARVWRDWPGTVRITVEPRVPVAEVPAAGGRTVLIDAYGYAVDWAPASAEPGVFPRLAVPFTGRLGDIHTAADGPLAVVAAMPDDLRAWVSAVTLDPVDGQMGLQLTGGATVALGEENLLDDKISAVRALLAGTELDCITEIDVIMPDIATVTRHRPCRPRG